MRAALAADPTHGVVVISKSSVQQSNSQWAQGGIAAVWNAEDNFESHAEDTVVAGQGLCDPAVVDHVVHEAPNRVQELIEWEGKISISPAPGKSRLREKVRASIQSRSRTVGDATGREIMRTVLERASHFSNIQLLENTDHRSDHSPRQVHRRDHLVRRGWHSDDLGQGNDSCHGGLCRPFTRETTNPPLATGDGLAMAYRGGRNCKTWSSCSSTRPSCMSPVPRVISSVKRCEGRVPYLRDSRGQRFMPNYDKREACAWRYCCSIDCPADGLTKHPCVYLDQRHFDPKVVRERFPGIAAAFAKCGLDFARGLIPVLVRGPITWWGDCRPILMGERPCRAFGPAVKLRPPDFMERIVSPPIACSKHLSSASCPDDSRARSWRNRFPLIRSSPWSIATPTASGRNSMWRTSGTRFKASCFGRSASSEIGRDWKTPAGREFLVAICACRSNSPNPPGWELQNMLLVAEVMIDLPESGQSSRGTHFRSDYPEVNDQIWRIHLASRRGQDHFDRIPLATAF